MLVYDRFQDLFRAALEGEVKVFVATELGLLYFLKENLLINIFEYDRDHPLYSQVYYTATKKGNPALIQAVNDGLKAIGSEERKLIEDKWIVRDFNDIPQESTAALSEKEKISFTVAEKRWLKEHPTVSVATEELPPYAFQEIGQPLGYTVDLLSAMADRAGLKLDIEFLKFNEVMEKIKSGEAEVTLNKVYSQERAAYLAFGENIFRIKQAIFAQTGRSDIHDLESLQGKTFAGEEGYAITRIIETKHPEIQIVPAKSMIDSLQMVSTGKADAAIMEVNMGQYLLTKNFINNLRVAGFADFFGKEGLKAHYWAVGKDHQILKSILDKAFRSLSMGDRQRLWNKWFQGEVKADLTPGKLINLTVQEKAWLNTHPVIRVHNEKDWPPFNYFEYGSSRGLSIDYMNLLAEQLGIKVEYVTGPSWNEFLEMAKRKELDVMLSIVKTEDRMKYLLFTEPYLKNPNVIVSSEENPYETIEALFGKTVAFPKGFFYEEVLTKLFPQITRLPVENTLTSLKAVTFGRADAALGEAAPVRTLINKNLLSGLRISGEVNIGDPDLTNLRLGIRDDWPLLHSALMKAMAAVTPQQMDQIRQKWIAGDVETVAAPRAAVPVSYGRLIAYGIAVFLILSLLAWILIKTIKKEHIAMSFGSGWFRGSVLAGLSFFVIIVCLLGWFTLEQNKEKILAGVSENLTELLKTADDRLNTWVAQRTSFLKLLGRDPELVILAKRLLAVSLGRKDWLSSDALGDVRAFFENKKDILSNTDFFIVNAEHNNIGSMRDADIGIRNLISLQKPDLLRRAFAGEVLFVPPIESDGPQGKASAADGAGNPSTKFFLGPIWDPNSQIIAVMALAVDPSKDFSWVLPSFESRKTAETYAFSGRGQMLSESRFDEQLHRIGLLAEDQKSAFNIEIRDPGVNLVKGQRPKIERSQQPFTRMASRTIQLKRAMEKRGQTYGRTKIEIDMKGYRDYRGVPVFGAWLWNADLGLGLATEIDVAEALSSYHQIRRTVFGVMGFTLFLSVGAVLLILILGERTSRALRSSQDELELRVQERTAELRKLSQATENSPASVVVTDKNGTIEYVNPTFSEVTGYSAEEAIGQNPKVLKSGNLPASYYKELWDTILSGNVWRGEFINKRKNGEEFWESASISLGNFRREFGWKSGFY